MSRYYRIRGLPGFDGLIAEGSPTVLKGDDGIRIDVIEVETLINGEVILGDRQLMFPMPGGNLFIGADVVIETDNPGLKEYTTQSPFGKLQYEGHLSKGTVHVDYATYENGMSVNVKDASVDPVKTVFSNNFYGDFAADAEESIEQALRNELDIDDLVFELNTLFETQGNQKS